MQALPAQPLKRYRRQELDEEEERTKNALLNDAEWVLVYLLLCVE
jgi:hypothetical protein